MADFDLAVEFLLANEGGYSNNPADPGGETNFGISKRSYPYVDISSLTRDEAIAIYKRDFWDPFRFRLLASQRVATKVFDAAVNLGPDRAVRILQAALNSVTAGPLVPDGNLGPETVAHANAADEDRLVDEFKARLVLYYCAQSHEQPSMGFGWFRRAVKG